VRIETIATLTAAPRDTVLSRKKYALAKLRVLLQELSTTGR
jgi:DNA-directed RNA polymerase specialized sigma24 family protein